MIVVVDTNILMIAICESSISHTCVMTNIIVKEHSLAFDYDEILLDEYRKNLGQNQFFQKWYAEVIKRNLVYFCSHHFPSRHKRELEKLGFHGEVDLTIVGLGWNGSKYLVTEDSDFGKSVINPARNNNLVLEYLNNKMGLTIHCADEANTQLII